MTDLTPEAIAARIERLRSVELSRAEPAARERVSMEPQAVARRLDELRALVDLAAELQRGRQREE